MKRITIFALCVFAAVYTVSAQTAPKFGYINMQEVIFLMDETDSARVELDKLSADMQSTYNAMYEELTTKYATYQQMSANWTPSVLATKEQELKDLEARLQQYQQNAQMDLSNLQNQLMAPIQQKAAEAVSKIAKANGLAGVFEQSVMPYIDPSQCMNLMDQVRTELGISPDKTLPQAQPQM